MKHKGTIISFILVLLSGFVVVFDHEDGVRIFAGMLMAFSAWFLFVFMMGE